MKYQGLAEENIMANAGVETFACQSVFKSGGAVLILNLLGCFFRSSCSRRVGDIPTDSQVILEFIESVNTMQALANDKGRPPVPNDTQRAGDGAGGIVEFLSFQFVVSVWTPETGDLASDLRPLSV